MLVFKSTYNKLLVKHDEILSMLNNVSVDLIQARRDGDMYKRKYHKLLAEWNALVRQINVGIDVRPKSLRYDSHNQFSKSEINDLIRLCHPDRHDGSQKSNEITAKLISLRNKT